MAVAYLHGVEIINVDKGAVPISVVKSAVVGLVGIAPKGPINTPIAVYGSKDAAQFGDPVPGFNIPQAIAAIFEQGAGTIIVVNVFDPDTMTAAVTNEAHNIESGGKFKLAYAPIGGVITLKNMAGSTTYTTPDQYTVDSYGHVTIVDRVLLPDGDTNTVKASYSKLDASTINAATIVGGIDDDNVRTGLKCFELCYNLFGFKPKILITPGYGQLSAVRSAFLAAAAQYKAVFLFSAPNGTLPADAIAGRGPTGSIDFDTSDGRAFLLYPQVKSYDPATDSDIDMPLDAFAAGLICKVDNNEGYWVSPSNHEINGISGLELPLSADILDANSDCNTLNAAGITTVFGAFGTGLRLWGNRTAAFPVSTAPKNFLAVQRTADVLEESIAYAMMNFIDKPINQALIDSIRDSVNAFMRTLIQRGALVDGSCIYDPNDNPPTELAAGHLTFTLDFMPPTPAERITFKSTVDISLLKFK